MLRFFVFLILLASTVTGRANTSEALVNRCGVHAGPRSWKYCVTLTPGSTNTHVVYYLHGGPGTEREWIEGHPEVRAVWRRLGFAPPAVVAISFAPEFLLVEKNAGPISGDYEVFLHEVIPFVEKELLGGRTTGRDIIGLSMGGFNASEVVFKNPALFRNVVLMCPMYVDLAPSATEAEIQAFMSRMVLKNWDPHGLLELMRPALPDAASWARSSPFILARQLRPGGLNPNVYLSYGRRDGFIDGDLEMSSILRQKLAHFTESIVDGGHCRFDEPGVAKFLMEQERAL